MKRASIRTMSELNKSTKVAVPGEAMYLRLLTINYQKQVPLERVMAYENAAVPLSIFSDEGFMLSGKKSTFLYKLESLIPGNPIQQVSDGDPIIFNLMQMPYSMPCEYQKKRLGKSPMQTWLIHSLLTYWH